MKALSPIERGGEIAKSGSDLPKPIKRFGQEEWAAVCERIQDAAEYIQEIEASGISRRCRPRKIFANMQDEIASANAVRWRPSGCCRMCSTGDQVCEDPRREKLQAAEDRAREAEDWLNRISEAVRSNLNFRRPRASGGSYPPRLRLDGHGIAAPGTPLRIQARVQRRG